MEDIVIYGSGGMAKEVVQLINDINRVKPSWNIAGYIDDIKGYCNEQVNGYKILGPGELLKDRHMPRYIVLAVSNPLARQNIYKRVRDDRLIFPVLIHPAAHIAESAAIGEGSIIGIDCIISVNVIIGKYAFLNMRTVVGHDTVIGDFSSCLVNCIIAGNVNIHEGVLLGSNCVIKEKTIVGKGAKVAMGAVVSFDVEDGYVVMSRPSKSMFFG